jgi:hypothetical protein
MRELIRLSVEFEVTQAAATERYGRGIRRSIDLGLKERMDELPVAVSNGRVHSGRCDGRHQALERDGWR